MNRKESQKKLTRNKIDTSIKSIENITLGFLLLVFATFNLAYAAPSITNLTTNQNINTAGRPVTFTWSANGITVYGWQLVVEQENWLGQYMSGQFAQDITQVQVDFDSFNLPQDGTPLFAKLRYATDPGWGEWRETTPVKFTAGGDVTQPPPAPPTANGIPVLTLEQVRAQTPSRPEYNLADLGAVTPELPAAPSILPLPSHCGGLSSDTPNTLADASIHWRRVTSRVNPLTWMVMAASDSDLKNDATRGKVWNSVNSFFEHLLAESLPQNNQAGDTNVNALSNFLGEPQGDFNGHPFVSFLIPYAELTQLQIAKNAVIGHAEWMLWQQKNGDHGFIQSPNNPFEMRIWMRRLKNLIVFSDSPILLQRPGLKAGLVTEANKMLTWLLNLTTDGTGDLSSIGWDVYFARSRMRILQRVDFC